MSIDEIIETAIQGHASTRDAIRWAIQQEREACVELCVLAEKMCKAVRLPTTGVGSYIAAAIRARGNE